MGWNRGRCLTWRAGHFVFTSLGTKSQKDKGMEPQEPAFRLARGAVPAVNFANGRELLNRVGVPGAVRSSYAAAIAGYLDYCRRNGLSVTIGRQRRSMPQRDMAAIQG